MTVRCKVRLVEIHNLTWGAKRYVFQAEYDTTIPEDQRFAKASPNARFEILVDNPTVHDKYQLGGYYYFDSIPVPVPAAVAA